MKNLSMARTSPGTVGTEASIKCGAPKPFRACVVEGPADTATARSKMMPRSFFEKNPEKKRAAEGDMKIIASTPRANSLLTENLGEGALMVL